MIHDDIKVMRAFLWDMGLIGAFEAYTQEYQMAKKPKPKPSTMKPGGCGK